jgi:hypothetical protein
VFIISGTGHPSLHQHLFEVAIAQWIAQIPAYAEENVLGFEVAPLEGTGLTHARENSSACSQYAEPIIPSAVFATEPAFAPGTEPGD